MMAWGISVFRQRDGGCGDRVAVWQSDSHGLQWLDALVADGHALALGGDGYPLRYSARAEQVIAQLAAGPPHAFATWMRGANDVVTRDCLGKTTIDAAVVEACRPDEWLLIEAWDES